MRHDLLTLIFDLLSWKMANHLLLSWGTFTPTLVVFVHLLVFKLQL